MSYSSGSIDPFKPDGNRSSVTIPYHQYKSTEIGELVKLLAKDDYTQDPEAELVREDEAGVRHG